MDTVEGQKSSGNCRGRWQVAVHQSTFDLWFGAHGQSSDVVPARVGAALRAEGGFKDDGHDFFHLCTWRRVAAIRRNKIASEPRTRLCPHRPSAARCVEPDSCASKFSPS